MDRAKQWIADHVPPLLESTITILRLMFIVVVVCMISAFPELMVTPVEVPLGGLIALFFLMALPNTIIAISQLWRFLRTMGEIEPPQHADREAAP